MSATNAIGAWSVPAASGRALELAAEAMTREQAREAISQFIASAFVIPVLEQLRESEGRAGPFAPGDAERRFGPLLDERIADRVVSGARFPLVDAIAERYVKSARSATSEVIDVAA